MELLLDKAGGKMTHVPFKGTGPAMTELLAGRVQVMFGTLGAVAPYLKSGALRAYGVSSPSRFEQLPQVPTIAEQGLPGYEAAAWQGVVAPAGLSEAARARLNGSLQRVLTSDATKKQLQEMGIEPVSGTPQQFEAYAKSQGKLWSDLIRAKGIRLE
jgi:tripartite-type tricarboxylate transporter receptor subunit TctC